MCRFFQFVCVCTLQPILLCKQQQEGESAMAARKVELCGMDTSQLPVLSEAEKSRLIEAAHNGDQDARQQMIQGNLRLVLSVVQKFASRGENLDDLFQVGCIGLIKAIDNFDPSQKVRFSTYGVPMICGEVKRYLRDNNAVRVSRSIRDLAYHSMQAREELQMRDGREPRSGPRRRMLPWRWNPPWHPPACTSRSFPTARTAFRSWTSCGIKPARKAGSAI